MPGARPAKSKAISYQMNKRVLITGGRGLVGRHLCDALVGRGYRVHVLTRSAEAEDTAQVRHFAWDVETGQIDPECLQGVAYIVHLAGESIGALPWSNRRKKAIADSRIDSIAILYRQMEMTPNEVKAVVSASASGYYGDRGDELLAEDQPPQEGFLGSTCARWEKAVQDGERWGLRTVSLRSGVVLTADGGMYGKLRFPARIGLGVVFGNGRQYLPWIHVEDAVQAYIHAMENADMSGAYNLVAPEQVTNAAFTKQVASHFGKSVWAPPVPAFVLKAVMGQMSELVLDSTRASADKLLRSGFEFRYPTLATAIAQCERASG